MAWVVYILQCSDGSLYTGITNHLEQRLHAHQQGTGAKYTRGRTPCSIIYQEEYQNRSEASMREATIKKLRRKEKLELIDHGSVDL
jgi:putative endonuclease